MSTAKEIEGLEEAAVDQFAVKLRPADLEEIEQCSQQRRGQVCAGLGGILGLTSSNLEALALRRVRPERRKAPKPLRG